MTRGLPPLFFDHVAIPRVQDPQKPFIKWFLSEMHDVEKGCFGNGSKTDKSKVRGFVFILNTLLSCTNSCPVAQNPRDNSGTSPLNPLTLNTLKWQPFSSGSVPTILQFLQICVRKNKRVLGSDPFMHRHFGCKRGLCSLCFIDALKSNKLFFVID